jgi:dephospho-CoA kinase
MGNIEPCVLGFSGRIASGKTTISQRVSNQLCWPRTSFGDFVRSAAIKAGGNAESRPVLQQFGEMLIAGGWQNFCENVLAAAEWQPTNPLVIDGIRHVEAVNCLTAIVAPLPFVLVYIAIDEHLRTRRARNRDCSTAVEESHSTECAVTGTLQGIAHLVVDGSSAVDAVVADVISFLERR